MKRIVLIATIFLLGFILGGCDTTAPVLKGIDKTVEVQCGSQFNLHDYLNKNLIITDETDEGIKDYKLEDLEYKITCDESIYNAETGNIETGDYGTFDVKLVVKDEKRNKETLEFQLFLNPVEVQKGYYMYPDDNAKGTFGVQCFCEIKNTSNQFLKISDINVQLIDKDDVVVYETDMPQYAAEYLDTGNICYIRDDFGGWDLEFNSENDIDDIVVDFKYERDKKENNNMLQVSDLKVHKTASNYEVTAIVKNNYDKGVDYYEILVGMYDKNGKLLGIMTSYGDTTSLAANGKGMAKVSWFPDSMSIPDKTKDVKGQARIITYEEE